MKVDMYSPFVVYSNLAEVFRTIANNHNPDIIRAVSGDKTVFKIMNEIAEQLEAIDKEHKAKQK